MSPTFHDEIFGPSRPFENIVLNLPPEWEWLLRVDSMDGDGPEFFHDGNTLGGGFQPLTTSSIVGVSLTVTKGDVTQQIRFIARRKVVRDPYAYEEDQPRKFPPFHIPMDENFIHFDNLRPLLGHTSSGHLETMDTITFRMTDDDQLLVIHDGSPMADEVADAYLLECRSLWRVVAANMDWLGAILSPYWPRKAFQTNIGPGWTINPFSMSSPAAFWLPPAPEHSFTTFAKTAELGRISSIHS